MRKQREPRASSRYHPGDEQLLWRKLRKTFAQWLERKLWKFLLSNALFAGCNNSFATMYALCCLYGNNVFLSVIMDIADVQRFVCAVLPQILCGNILKACIHSSPFVLVQKVILNNWQLLTTRLFGILSITKRKTFNKVFFYGFLRNEIAHPDIFYL